MSTQRDDDGQAASASFPHLPAESWRLFLDDRLPAVSTARLEAHLAECEECRAVLEDADPTRIFRRLRTLEVRDQAWVGFWDGIAARLPERSAAPPHRATASPANAAGPPPAHGRRSGGRALAAGAAATVALMLALAVMVSRDSVTGIDHDAADPCPPAVAELNLSGEECRALFGTDVDAPGAREVILRADLDLRGL